jgi:hypothetical protein
MSNPRFPRSTVLGSGEPFVVTDDEGVAWRIEPGSGHASPITFSRPTSIREAIEKSSRASA